MPRNVAHGRDGDVVILSYLVVVPGIPLPTPPVPPHAHAHTQTHMHSHGTHNTRSGCAQSAVRDADREAWLAAGKEQGSSILLISMP